MTRRVDPVVLILLVLSAAYNIYLHSQLGARTTPKFSLVKVGDTLPTLRGKGLDGRDIVVSYEMRPAILYVFSPACSWCERNLDNARALSEKLADKYDFIAISTIDGQLDKYVGERHLRWRVVKEVPDDLRQSYRLGPTPVTMVIEVGGRVRQVWAGAYAAEVQAEVERALQTILPGLRDVKRQPS